MYEATERHLNMQMKRRVSDGDGDGKGKGNRAWQMLLDLAFSPNSCQSVIEAYAHSKDGDVRDGRLLFMGNHYGFTGVDSW